MTSSTRALSVGFLFVGALSCAPSSLQTADGDSSNNAPAPDGGSDGGSSCPGATFLAPLSAPASALIVTSQALRATFEKYALLHSVTGVPTEVTTVEDICATATCNNADPRHDMAKAIKALLRAKPGLKYLVIGGDIEIVPSRMVHDQYTNPMMPSINFVADFDTDFYYSDLSVWDTNGDGIYAQDPVDTPAYLPNLAVSRVSVKTAAEADAYLAKVTSHCTNFDPASVGKVALISNIATKYNYNGFPIDIDSAFYFESPGRSLSLLPSGASVTKLYATKMVDPNAGATTPAAEIQAMTQGQNLVVHSGHGGEPYLTVEQDGTNALTGAMAYAMTNATNPIFFSCACEAANFASPLGDTAGELFLKAPAGGGVAYLGNGPVGLGLAGGMQLIDETLRYIQATAEPLLADAYYAGHAHLPKSDSFTLPVVNVAIPVLDITSYRWTQKAVVALGDYLIPVWKGARQKAPALGASKQALCTGSRITFTFAAPVSGTLRFRTATASYEAAVSGGSVSVDLREAPTHLTAGFASPQSFHGYYDLTL